VERCELVNLHFDVILSLFLLYEQILPHEKKQKENKKERQKEVPHIPPSKSNPVHGSGVGVV